MKVQILRKPDLGDVDLPVGTVIDLPPALARPMLDAGEAVLAPQSARTRSLMTVSLDPVTKALVGGDGQPISVGGGGGAPVAFAANRELTDDDNGKTLVCTGTRIATVNTGRVAGFGVAATGAITFSGTATITDKRVTGVATPSCVLLNVGSDAYDVLGSKT